MAIGYVGQQILKNNNNNNNFRSIFLLFANMKEHGKPSPKPTPKPLHVC